MANALAKLNLKEMAFKTRQRLHAANSRAAQAVASANQKSKAIVASMAENTLLETGVETAGVMAEAAAKIKAPGLQKYLPVIGLGVELFAIYSMTQRTGSGKKLTEYKTLGALGRGFRARATVTMADDAMGKLLNK